MSLLAQFLFYFFLTFTCLLFKSLFKNTARSSKMYSISRQFLYFKCVSKLMFVSTWALYTFPIYNDSFRVNFFTYFYFYIQRTLSQCLNLKARHKPQRKQSKPKDRKTEESQTTVIKPLWLSQRRLPNIVTIHLPSIVDSVASLIENT